MDKNNTIDPNERVEAVWCVDSETGEQVLMDRLTNKPIARKDKDGNILPLGVYDA